MPNKPPKPSTPRPVIVARISKEKIARGWSLEAQVDECRAWCQRNLGVGVPDEDVQTEDGVSGRKRTLAQRPGLSAAVEGAKAGAYTHIIFHAVDRGARNLKVMCDVLDAAEVAGVPVVSVVDNQRSDTSSGKSFFQMVTMMAEWQADRTSEQIKAMQRARRAVGLPNGPTPFGVMYADGKPAPDSRPVILNGVETTYYDGLLMIYRMRADDKSIREITAAANASGYRSCGTHVGNLLTTSSIYFILMNRFYIGEIPDGSGEKDQRTMGNFDPIIPRELWDTVQAVNDRRKQHKQSMPSGSKAYSLGGGLVRCVACLARGVDVGMHVFQSRRKATWDGSLRCAGHTEHGTCDQPSVPLRLLNQQMEWVLHRLAMPAEDARVLLETYLGHQAGQQRQQTAASELRALEARLERQRRLFELGDWDEDRYRNERDPLVAEVERLRQVAAPVAISQLYDLSDYLRDMAQAWRDADHAQKQQMAQLLFQAVYVHDKRIVAVKPSREFWPVFAALNVTSDSVQLQNANGTGLDETLNDALPGDAIRISLTGTVASRRSSYLPDEQWQRLYAAYQTGTCYADLAALFGISIRAVQYGIHDEKVRRGVPTRRADRPYPRKGGAR